MKSYCLKCRKDTENINPRVSNTIIIEQWYYQNVQYVEAKNQDSLKIKKQKDLSNLYIRTALSKVPISGDILF